MKPILLAIALFGAIAAAAVAGYLFAVQQMPARHIESGLDRPTNLFDQHLLQSGLLACNDLFGRLGGELTAGAQFAARSNWIKDSGDRPNSIAAVVGMVSESAKGNPPQSSGVLFAVPGRDGTGCAGQFVRVSYVLASCTDFAAARPSDSAVDTELAGLTTIALPSGETVMLLPADRGCVVTTSKQL